MLAGADGLAVVNVVTLESYLLGVVASEMPSDWKPEALEAQAIAARTYAVATRKPASSPYDLYPDQRSQVYRGLAGEGASSSAAVDATAGQVVLYQGQPIVTYFSSSSGGRTAAVQESLPGVDPAPYLVSVDDPLDTISPYHDWTLSLDDRDLSQKAVYPGLITGVQINAYPSGRVNTVTFNGSAGPLVLSASLVRKRLGLRSTWFTSTPGAPAARTTAIVLHSRVVRDRVLLTGNAPPGAVTLQGGGSPSWRDIATHPVADDGAVSFRRPVGEAARYRLVAGSLSSPAVPVIRHSGLVLRGRPGARLHGRLFPKGALGFVALQHVIGGRWTWVARAKTRADGSFRFTVRADGGRWRVRWRGAGSFLGSLSPELRVGRRTLAWTPTDPLAAREWNLTAVNAFGYADTLPVLQEAPATVAVIDSGIDRTSPDLAGAVPLAPIDEAHDPIPSLIHGTAVAGIIAADANNGVGGVGIGAPYARLLDYRVVSGGDVDPNVEAEAIRDAVGAGARVINLSLGGNRDPKDPELDEFSRAERDAISYAVGRGTVVVAAVGNASDDAGIYASWPAALRHVIGVSAVTQASVWAPFSNTDPVFNDIAAPGVGIITTVPRSLAPTGSSLDAPAGVTIQAGWHSDGHVVLCAARECRSGRAARPAPRVHSDAGHLDSRAHGTSPGRQHGHRARSPHGLRAARRHGGSEVRRRSRGRPAAAGPRRAERCRQGGADPGHVRRVGRRGRRFRRRQARRLQGLRARGRDAQPPHRVPATGRQPRARRRGLSTQQHESRQLAEKRAQADSPDRGEWLAERQQLDRHGRLVPRAGLGAARLGRLPHALERRRASSKAGPSVSGAEQLLGRDLAQDARGLAHHHGARRHVA